MALCVFVYILLIGPVDYLFLKRVVRRMELTWVTFPLIVVATSIAAYAAAYAVKGTELKVIKVDAVDVDQTTGRVRGTSWVTLFSPHNHDYNVSLWPRLNLEQADVPASFPSASVERQTTWFGPAESRLGGGSTGRMSLSSASYRYVGEVQDARTKDVRGVPNGLPEQLQGVRVPIWSTKSFAGRWTAPLPAPLVKANLVPVSNDRIEGTIENLSDRGLKDTALVFNNQVYDQLGPIAPGGQVQITFSSRVRPLSGYLEERAQNSLAQVSRGGNAPAGASQNDRIADLVRVVLFRDGMRSKTTAPPSLPLHDLDLTGQLALDRPMLLATLDGPAVDLRLDDRAQVPRIEQTTIVRVILTLRKEP